MKYPPRSLSARRYSVTPFTRAPVGMSTSAIAAFDSIEVSPTAGILSCGKSGSAAATVGTPYRPRKAVGSFSAASFFRLATGVAGT